MNTSDTPRPVAFVVGSYPPDRCGVGDYTARLVEALRRRGREVTVILAPKRTRWHDVNRAPRGVIVHVEYPTVGIGASLAPLLLLLRRRRDSVLTVHEFSLAHPLRKAMVLALTMAARRVVFTTDFERDAVARRVPVRRRATVIPIGVNVTVTPTEAPPTFAAGYFGLLGPGKGLETFLDLVRLSVQHSDGLTFCVIGGWPPANEAYVSRMRADTANLPIEWTGPLDDVALSRAIQSMRTAYLPFPDGASDRRGSLLATLAHGVPTLTTAGPPTPLDLRAALLIVDSAADARDQLLALDDAPRKRVAAAGRAFLAERSWDRIAALHEQVYEELRAPR